MAALAEAYVRIRPDTTGFKAEAAAAINRDTPTARAKVDVDTAAAQVKTRAVKSELDSVNGKTARPNIRVDSGPALRQIALVAAALAGLAAGAAAVGIAAIGGAVLGAGIGAAVAGLTGVGDAVKALGDAQKGAGQEAASAATKQLSLAGAMDQVRSAQASLANTIATASDTEREAAERVTDAQRNLTQARKDAAKQLRDLALQQQDLALQQRGAALDIKQAQHELDKVRFDPRATDLQRAQAKLAFDEAVQHNKELAVQAKDLAATKADADRRGVAGSQQVIDAQKQLQDAVRASAAAQREGAFQIAQAQQAVVSAQRAVQAASVSAGAVGVSAVDKINDAMRNLSPAGQEFAKFMRGFIDGPLRQLRDSTQQGFLPGLQAGLASLGPVIQKNLPAIQSFSKVFGQAIGGIIEVGGKLATPFLKLATAGLQALAPLKPLLEDFATAFGMMVDRLTKSGAIQAVMSGVIQVFSVLLTALPELIPPFLQLAADILPPLATTLEALLPALANLAVAMGPLLVEALRDVTPLLQWFGDFVRDHASLVRDLAVAILIGVAALKTLNAVMAILNANPVTLIVLAIVGLVAAFILAWRHSETFRTIVLGVFSAVREGAADIMHALDAVGHAFGNVVTFVKGAARDIKQWWNDAVNFVKSVPGAIANLGKNMFDAGVHLISELFKGILHAPALIGHIALDIGKAIVNGVIDLLNDILPHQIGPIHIPYAPDIPAIPLIPRIPNLRARGGFTPPGFTVVGEEGPELVDFASPGRVYTAQETRNMLNPAGSGGRWDQPMPPIVTKVILDGRVIAEAVHDYDRSAARALPRG